MVEKMEFSIRTFDDKTRALKNGASVCIVLDKSSWTTWTSPEFWAPFWRLNCRRREVRIPTYYSINDPRLQWPPTGAVATAAGVSEDSPCPIIITIFVYVLCVRKKADRVPPGTGSWHRGLRSFIRARNPATAATEIIHCVRWCHLSLCVIGIY